MKIKFDFVTNSSSTAFVVMVPNNFYTNEEEIKELYNSEYDMYDSYEEAKDNEAFDELHDCIEELKDGRNVWHYGDDGLQLCAYNSLLNICSKHKFIITSLDMNGEGNNIIQGVKEETIKNILINNMDIMSMFESILREDKDVNAKNK